MNKRTMLLAGLTLSLAGCGVFGGREHGPGQGLRSLGPPPGAPLMHYADNDGKVTWAALTAGLKSEYAAADKNHDGCLDADEVRAINEARWVADKTASPLVDWSQKNCITFEGFAAGPRSLFQQLDAKGTGVLTPEELLGAAGGGQSRGQGDQSGQRRGRRGGGQGGPGGGQPGVPGGQ